MDKLRLELEALHQETKILEPSNDEREKINELISSFINEYLNRLSSNKSFENGKVNSSSALSIDNEREEINGLIKTIKSEVLNPGIRASSGGHLGYIPGGGIWLASVADYIVAATNEYVGVKYASPGGVKMEREVILWIAKQLEFSGEVVGNLTSGGSIANLTAIIAARDYFKIKNHEIEDCVVYFGESCHHSIDKALKISGLKDVVRRKYNFNRDEPQEISRLRKDIFKDKKEGKKPILIVSTAGSTNVGSVDNLHLTGKIAKQEGLWYHVDAAYGGFFNMLEEKNSLFKGLELADSITIDPHKGMFLPYGIGCILLKMKPDLLSSYKSSASYMQDQRVGDDNISSFEPSMLSPELSTHFRAMRIWLPLKFYGKEPFKKALKEKVILTKYTRYKLKLLGFQLGPEPDLTVTYFWFESKIVDNNSFNKTLLKLSHKDGSAFVSSTMIQEQFVIRVAILSFRTKKSDIDRFIEMIGNCLTKTKELYEKNQSES